MIKRALNLDMKQLAWLAGLLEGEAYFGQHPTSKQTTAPVVELNSVDHDVISRVHRLYAARYGIAVNIHIRPPRHAGYQPQYQLACFGAAARAIMADIAPLMGARRRARIEELAGAHVQPQLLGESRACYDLRGPA